MVAMVAMSRGIVGRACLALVMAALVAVSPGRVFAQASTGTIGGTIADPQGQVIPGVTITVINEATNDERVVVTDERGEFQVTNLQPTAYTIRAALESFRTHERKNVVLSAGERLSLGTIGLEVGKLGETVTVKRAAARSISPKPSTPG